MRFFSIIKWASRRNFGGDGWIACGLQFRLVAPLGGVGKIELELGMGVNGRTVLGAVVIPLAHALGGIMIFPENLEQCSITDRIGLIDDQHCFSMAGVATADFGIRGVGSESSGIAHGRGINPVKGPKCAFGTPEASHREDCGLQPLGERRS